ncbi:uncharacterized protein LAESUDRAFT_762384 [Laetiporus sulphureus 93-53]|uniref:Uncharacterized protein n=1 Tax=Laetiporus sulphureus 93-53 TaxID=1314785 RepID=A0A165CK75_9APHY|nr:uncharacterized protein LAESUDRAFT_762384 [Laetiporus sulphureus 93-53]KZT02963.1 hypothetical protein LAESUDRAFT_762384 [Laetiporus sulphureus 93-53]
MASVARCALLAASVAALVHWASAATAQNFQRPAFSLTSESTNYMGTSNGTIENGPLVPRAALRSHDARCSVDVDAQDVKSESARACPNVPEAFPVGTEDAPLVVPEREHKDTTGAGA